MGGCCWKRGRQAWAWPGPCSGPRGHPVVFQAWRAVHGPAPWATPGCGPASFLCESVPAWEEGSRQGQWLSVRDNKSRILALGSLGSVGRGDGQNPDHSCHVSALLAALEQERVHPSHCIFKTCPHLPPLFFFPLLRNRL